MRIYNAILRASAAAVLAVAVASCFTGVESTPRIGSGEVRRNQAARRTDEQLFLTEITPKAPSLWQTDGVRFKIDDERFARVLAPGTPAPAQLAGRVVAVEGFSPAVSLTGEDATDIILTDVADGSRLTCRVAVAAAAIDTVSRLEIPFTVDMDLVARTDSALRGRTLYISTPNWYDGRGNDVAGLRHVAAHIDSVVPGSYLYPAAVYFTLTDSTQVLQARIADGDRRFLYMSVGGAGASSRTFDRLFSFESPRRRHPEISDRVWQLIVQSRVEQGMTPSECRLALGAPDNIRRVSTRAGMRETWSYADGVFLVFDDGFLSRYRL